MDNYKLSKIFISALNSDLSELYVKGMRNAINMNASPDGENEEYYRKEEAFDKEFDKNFGEESVWLRFENEWTRQYPIKNEQDERVMRRVFNQVMRQLLLIYRSARFSGKTSREATLEIMEILKAYYSGPTIA